MVSGSCRTAPPGTASSGQYIGRMKSSASRSSVFDVLARQVDPRVGRHQRLERHDLGGLIDAGAMQVEVGVTPSKARAPSNTDVHNQAACVRTPMIGTLPSCQSSSKNVTVFDHVTGRLIESSFGPPYCPIAGLL